MNPNYNMQYQGQNVVTSQPQLAGQIQNIKPWSSGICGCCQDMAGCCYCYWCFLCFTCTLASKMDECVLGPCCCYGFLTAMRTKLRTQYGIKQSKILGAYLGFKCTVHQVVHIRTMVIREFQFRFNLKDKLHGFN
ncbi:hypothetical protein HELRODRAFT_168982 [Helobdella robusta]|uniref:Uncharacterized protein n=1 Tax=Helobdella robusta TaxID=6412 RepID=T1F179_HELRO|nr:hypothetical protein HELRODRAFT_168982 [Helobdella robusta]ESO09048.1 hypothetical protein HELRODRAFT_168982 [Helobdella robusta]